MVIHLFAYAGVCGMLIAIWALGETGSFEQVADFVREPETIDAAAFWPVWVIVTWGAAVVVHLGAVVGLGLFGRRRRRQRREGLATATRASTEAVRRVVDGLQGRSGQGPAGRGTASGAAAVPERQWVTVMFTDIVNSTQLTEALGDEAWSRILRAHRELVRHAILDRGGDEVATQGDGFMARFSAPADAVLCAVDIQRAIEERQGDDSVVPEVRIGIHAGEAVHDDGDLVGQVVNLASRVAGEAGPGEILVTEPVADYLGSRLSFLDRGVRELKGISQPRHLLAVVWDTADVADGGDDGAGTPESDTEAVEAPVAESPAD